MIDPELTTVLQEQKGAKILNWLSFLSKKDYSKQQADFLRQRQEGTGQWFLESRQFKEWYSLCFLRTWLIPIFLKLISPPGYQQSQ